MPANFLGPAFLVVDGLPTIHVKSIDKRVTTNRELVLGMSPTGTAVGFVDGPKEYTLSLELYIPVTGDIPWENITDGIIQSVSTAGTPLTTFIGVFVTEVGDTYQEKGGAVRKVEAKALAVVEES